MRDRKQEGSRSKGMTVDELKENMIWVRKGAKILKVLPIYNCRKYNLYNENV